MPSERVNTAVAYLRTGSRAAGPLREMRLTADEHEDLLAAVRWDYETARGIKDAVQSLAAKQRGEEAAGRSAGERRAGRPGRYSKWDIERELSSGGQANTFLVRDRTLLDGQRHVLQVLKNPKRLEPVADEGPAATPLHPSNRS